MGCGLSKCCKNSVKKSKKQQRNIYKVYDEEKTENTPISEKILDKIDKATDIHEKIKDGLEKGAEFCEKSIEFLDKHTDKFGEVFSKATEVIDKIAPWLGPIGLGLKIATCFVSLFVTKKEMTMREIGEENLRLNKLILKNVT